MIHDSYLTHLKKYLFLTRYKIHTWYKKLLPRLKPYDVRLQVKNQPEALLNEPPEFQLYFRFILYNSY